MERFVMDDFQVQISIETLSEKLHLTEQDLSLIHIFSGKIQRETHILCLLWES